MSSPRVELPKSTEEADTAARVLSPYSGRDERTRTMLEQLASTDAAINAEEASAREQHHRKRAEAVYQLLLYTRSRVEERQRVFESELKTWERLCGGAAPEVAAPSQARSASAVTSKRAETGLTSRMSASGSVPPSPRASGSSPAVQPRVGTAEQRPVQDGAVFDRPTFDAVAAVDDVLNDIGHAGYPEPVASIINGRDGHFSMALLPPPTGNPPSAQASPMPASVETSATVLLERVFALERAVRERDELISHLGARVKHRRGVLDIIRGTLLREVNALKYRALTTAVTDANASQFSLFDVVDLVEHADDIDKLLNKVRDEYARAAELRDARRDEELKEVTRQLERELSLVRLAKKEAETRIRREAAAQIATLQERVAELQEATRGAGAARDEAEADSNVLRSANETLEREVSLLKAKVAMVEQDLVDRTLAVAAKPESSTLHAPEFGTPVTEDSGTIDADSQVQSPASKRLSVSGVTRGIVGAMRRRRPTVAPPDSPASPLGSSKKVASKGPPSPRGFTRPCQVETRATSAIQVVTVDAATDAWSLGELRELLSSRAVVDREVAACHMSSGPDASVTARMDCQTCLQARREASQMRVSFNLSRRESNAGSLSTSWRDTAKPESSRDRPLASVTVSVPLPIVAAPAVGDVAGHHRTPVPPAIADGCSPSTIARALDSSSSRPFLVRSVWWCAFVMTSHAVDAASSGDGDADASPISALEAALRESEAMGVDPSEVSADDFANQPGMTHLALAWFRRAASANSFSIRAIREGIARCAGIAHGDGGVFGVPSSGRVQGTGPSAAFATLSVACELAIQSARPALCAVMDVSGVSHLDTLLAKDDCLSSLDNDKHASLQTPGQCLEGSFRSLPSFTHAALATETRRIVFTGRPAIPCAEVSDSLCRGLAATDPLDALALKGSDEPVAIISVAGSPGASRDAILRAMAEVGGGDCIVALTAGTHFLDRLAAKARNAAAVLHTVLVCPFVPKALEAAVVGIASQLTTQGTCVEQRRAVLLHCVRSGAISTLGTTESEPILSITGGDDEGPVGADQTMQVWKAATDGRAIAWERPAFAHMSSEQREPQPPSAALWFTSAAMDAVNRHGESEAAWLASSGTEVVIASGDADLRYLVLSNSAFGSAGPQRHYEQLHGRHEGPRVVVHQRPACFVAPTASSLLPAFGSQIAITMVLVRATTHVVVPQLCRIARLAAEGAVLDAPCSVFLHGGSSDGDGAVEADASGWSAGDALAMSISSHFARMSTEDTKDARQPSTSQAVFVLTRTVDDADRVGRSVSIALAGFEDPSAATGFRVIVSASPADARPAAPTWAVAPEDFSIDNDGSYVFVGEKAHQLIRSGGAAAVADDSVLLHPVPRADAPVRWLQALDPSAARLEQLRCGGSSAVTRAMLRGISMWCPATPAQGAACGTVATFDRPSRDRLPLGDAFAGGARGSGHSKNDAGQLPTLLHDPAEACSPAESSECRFIVGLWYDDGMFGEHARSLFRVIRKAVVAGAVDNVSRYYMHGSSCNGLTVLLAASLQAAEALVTEASDWHIPAARSALLQLDDGWLRSASDVGLGAVVDEVVALKRLESFAPPGVPVLATNKADAEGHNGAAFWSCVGALPIGDTSTLALHVPTAAVGGPAVVSLVAALTSVKDRIMRVPLAVPWPELQRLRRLQLPPTATIRAAEEGRLLPWVCVVPCEGVPAALRLVLGAKCTLGFVAPRMPVSAADGRRPRLVTIAGLADTATTPQADLLRCLETLRSAEGPAQPGAVATVCCDAEPVAVAFSAESSGVCAAHWLFEALRSPATLTRLLDLSSDEKAVLQLDLISSIPAPPSDTSRVRETVVGFVSSGVVACVLPKFGRAVNRPPSASKKLAVTSDRDLSNSVSQRRIVAGSTCAVAVRPLHTESLDPASRGMMSLFVDAIAESHHGHCARRSWSSSDGFVFLFQSAVQALSFALDTVDVVATAPWSDAVLARDGFAAVYDAGDIFGSRGQVEGFEIGVHLLRRGPPVAVLVAPFHGDPRIRGTEWMEAAVEGYANAVSLAAASGAISCDASLYTAEVEGALGSGVESALAAQSVAVRGCTMRLCDIRRRLRPAKRNADTGDAVPRNLRWTAAAEDDGSGANLATVSPPWSGEHAAWIVAFSSPAAADARAALRRHGLETAVDSAGGFSAATGVVAMLSDAAMVTAVGVLSAVQDSRTFVTRGTVHGCNTVGRRRAVPEFPSPHWAGQAHEIVGHDVHRALATVGATRSESFATGPVSDSHNLATAVLMDPTCAADILAAVAEHLGASGVSIPSMRVLRSYALHVGLPHPDGVRVLASGELTGIRTDPVKSRLVFPTSRGDRVQFPCLPICPSPLISTGVTGRAIALCIVSPRDSLSRCRFSASLPRIAWAQAADHGVAAGFVSASFDSLSDDLGTLLLMDPDAVFSVAIGPLCVETVDRRARLGCAGLSRAIQAAKVLLLGSVSRACAIVDADCGAVDATRQLLRKLGLDPVTADDGALLGLSAPGQPPRLSTTWGPTGGLRCLAALDRNGNEAVNAGTTAPVMDAPCVGYLLLDGASLQRGSDLGAAVMHHALWMVLNAAAQAGTVLGIWSPSSSRIGVACACTTAAWQEALTVTAVSIARQCGIACYALCHGAVEALPWEVAAIGAGGVPTLLPVGARRMAGVLGDIADIGLRCDDEADAASAVTHAIPKAVVVTDAWCAGASMAAAQQAAAAGFSLATVLPSGGTPASSPDTPGLRMPLGAGETMHHWRATASRDVAPTQLAASLDLLPRGVPDVVNSTPPGAGLDPLAVCPSAGASERPGSARPRATTPSLPRDQEVVAVFTAAAQAQRVGLEEAARDPTTRVRLSREADASPVASPSTPAPPRSRPPSARSGVPLRPQARRPGSGSAVRMSLTFSSSTKAADAAERLSSTFHSDSGAGSVIGPVRAGSGVGTPRVTSPTDAGQLPRGASGTPTSAAWGTSDPTPGRGASFAGGPIVSPRQPQLDQERRSSCASTGGGTSPIAGCGSDALHAGGTLTAVADAISQTTAFVPCKSTGVQCALTIAGDAGYAAPAGAARTPQRPSTATGCGSGQRATARRPGGTDGGRFTLIDEVVSSTVAAETARRSPPRQHAGVSRLKAAADITPAAVGPVTAPATTPSGGVHTSRVSLGSLPPGYEYGSRPSTARNR